MLALDLSLRLSFIVRIFGADYMLYISQAVSPNCWEGLAQNYVFL
jgi:hypothetical protein